MSTAARIVMIVVAILILLLVLRLVGARRLRSKYALLWLVVGAGTVLLAAVPAIADATADAIGVEDAPALLLLGASVVLLLICMHYSWELSRLEVRTRRLAEEIALLRQRLDESPADAEESPG